MGRLALRALIAIQASVIVVACSTVCSAQDKALRTSGEEKLPSEVEKYVKDGVHDWGQGQTPMPTKVGELGRFKIQTFFNKVKPRSYRMWVGQILEGKVLINFDFGSTATETFRPERDGNFFVKGIDAKGLVSDADWTPAADDLFEVADTETYKTVDGGTRTVFVLSKVRTDRINAYLDAQAQVGADKRAELQRERDAARREEEAKQAAAEEAKWRAWTDQDGTSHFEAKINGLINGVVLLKKRDGTVARFPLETMPTDDHDAVKKWIKAHK